VRGGGIVIKKNLFNAAGLVLVIALASILLACPAPTDSGTGYNPPTAAFPPTDYQVSGAGTGAVDGNYSQSGTFNLTPGTDVIFNFAATDDATRRWGIRSSTSDVAYYAPSAPTPSEGVWTTGGGTNPAPNVLRMPISGSKKISYPTVSADDMQWLRIEVTPVDEHGTAGTPVLSPSIQMGTS
jgi:hypothetical protein